MLETFEPRQDHSPLRRRHGDPQARSHASSHTDDATRASASVRSMTTAPGVILDPHTAVGYLGLRRELQRRHADRRHPPRHRPPGQVPGDRRSGHRRRGPAAAAPRRPLGGSTARDADPGGIRSAQASARLLIAPHRRRGPSFGGAARAPRRRVLPSGGRLIRLVRQTEKQGSPIPPLERLEPDLGGDGEPAFSNSSTDSLSEAGCIRATVSTNSDRRKSLKGVGSPASTAATTS